MEKEVKMESATEETEDFLAGVLFSHIIENVSGKCSIAFYFVPR